MKLSRGFTLIELMVVISIIAILSVIAVGIYGGAQGGARDARRRQEIDVLAKNIESAYDPSTGTYQYTLNDAAKDYPDIRVAPHVPKDPGQFTYCVGTLAIANPPPAKSPYKGDANCDVNYRAVGLSVSNNIGGVLDLLEDDAVKSWTLCASLERSKEAYCKSSLVR